MTIVVHRQEPVELFVRAPSQRLPRPVYPAGLGAGIIAPDLDQEAAAQWCARIARAAVEVSLGQRPAAQLARWLTMEVYEALSRRGGLARRIRPELASCRTQVRAIKLSVPKPTAVEASAVVADGFRVRAVALRIEEFRSRWRVSELIIG